MNKEVGLWIDQGRAVVVTLMDGTVETRLVGSHLDGGLYPAARWLARPAMDDASQGAHARPLTGRLGRYYDEITWIISDAAAIAIFGPGDAKSEVVKRLQGRRLGDLIVAVETASQMTPPQIVAKVRQHFAKQPS